MISFPEFSKFIITLAYAIPKFAPDFKDPVAVKVWYNEFKDFDHSDLQLVFVKAKKSLSSFPSMKQMHEFINPDNTKNRELKISDARDSASRVISSVSKFGYTRPEDAKAYVGPLGWIAIERMGGWVSFCEMLNTDNIGQLQAQIRDLCDSQLTRQSFGFDINEPAAIGITGSKLANELIEGLCESKRISTYDREK